MIRIKVNSSDKRQFSQQYGSSIEMEHENTYNWFANEIKKNKKIPSKEEFFFRIAEDHLQEFPDYYTLLRVMEYILKDIENKNEADFLIEWHRK